MAKNRNKRNNKKSARRDSERSNWKRANELTVTTQTKREDAYKQHSKKESNILH